MNESTWSRPGLPAAITDGRLVAIVRGRRAEHLQQVCATLIDAGVGCLELTLNTPGALEVLTTLRDAPGWVGAGTVLNVEQVAAVAEAGGSFCVSPVVDRAVGEACHAHGIAWFPGAATPTEIHRAWEYGAAAVKVFPAASLGGPAFLRDVLAPLDEIPLMPTGGIGIDDLRSYLGAGAVAVGLGGSLLGDSLRTGDLSGLRERAQAALAAAH